MTTENTAATPELGADLPLESGWTIGTSVSVPDQFIEAMRDFIRAEMTDGRSPRETMAAVTARAASVA